MSQYYDYTDFESITVADTAIGFTSTKIINSTSGKAARAVFCRLETAEVRYRLDGTDPTDSEGTLLKVNETLLVEGYNNIRRFRAIRTGSSGTLKAKIAF